MNTPPTPEKALRAVVVEPNTSVRTVLEYLLDDEASRERMGRAAREFAGSLSWEAVVEGILELHSTLSGVPPDLATSV